MVPIHDYPSITQRMMPWPFAECRPRRGAHPVGAIRLPAGGCTPYTRASYPWRSAADTMLSCSCSLQRPSPDGSIRWGCPLRDGVSVQLANKVPGSRRPPSPRTHLASAAHLSSKATRLRRCCEPVPSLAGPSFKRMGIPIRSALLDRGHVRDNPDTWPMPVTDS